MNVTLNPQEMTKEEFEYLNTFNFKKDQLLPYEQQELLRIYNRFFHKINKQQIVHLVGMKYWEF